jgi:hypothetical protein
MRVAAYEWLGKSVERFPNAQAFRARLRRQQFAKRLFGPPVRVIPAE